MPSIAHPIASEPCVDVTVRNLSAFESIVALVRQAAHVAVGHGRHPGPYVVSAEGLLAGRVFVTVRLGHAPSAPEWGLLGDDVEATVRGAFALATTGT